MTEAKREAIYGPEPWQRSGGVAWSHWDLWFCLVARLDHDGDLVALADAIGDEHRFYGHSDTEAKLSHLDDLADRLAAAGLDAGALAARAGDHGALRTKARTKVLKQGLQPRALTGAMGLTPRKRLHERALRGRWDRFPVSPQPWYDRMVYAKVPVDATGLAPEEWCEDLCELLAWENHGLLMKRETAMFARVHGPLADHAEQVLLALAAESRPRQVAGVVRSG